MMGGLKSQGQQKTAIAGVVPASIGGINTVSSLARMAAEECVFSYNIIAKDYGMEVRPGYVEWANGWTGTAKTIIKFEGATTADDKLWVATEDGIYDVTAADTVSPTLKIAFASTAGDAGICSYITFSTSGSDQFVLLCDGENGYYVWTQSTDTWAKITTGGGGGGGTQISNVDPANFCFVMAWKERVWFIEKGTSKAWYLAVNSIYGSATSFVFGSMFLQGGDLRAMYNWTLDGGAGIDDYLVILSGAGDVLTYQGVDPSSDVTMRGSWNIGKIPAYSRIGYQFGGELYIASSRGVIAMSSLLNGANVNKIESYLSAKVSIYYRAVVDTVLDEFGWDVVAHPKESLLYINTPAAPGEAQVSFCMYFGSGAWSMVSGLQKKHTVEWQGETYWTDGTRLYIEQGNVDEVYIDAATDGDPQPISWQLLSSYTDLDYPGLFKRCGIIRPNFLAEDTPSYEILARYDYDISEIASTPVASFGNVGTWDAGIWGTSVWAGGLSNSASPQGATGIGRTIAISIKGVSASPSVLLAYDVVASPGGPL
jgi:hypothetical protein